MYGPNDALGSAYGNSNSGCSSVILVLIIVGAGLFALI